MSSSLRPHARRLGAQIFDVIPFGGGLAASTGTGIELIDEDGASTRIPPPEGPRGAILVPLGDGRLLVREHRVTHLHVGARGGGLVKVDAGDAFFHDVAPTGVGFIATTSDKVLVDWQGERQWIELPGRLFSTGATPCARGVVLAGSEGMALLDETGAVRGRNDLHVFDRPVAVGGRLAVPLDDEIVVLDGTEERLRIPAPAKSHQIRPFQSGILIDGDEEITFWDLDGDEAEQAWSFSRAQTRIVASVAGDRVVIGTAYEKGAWILDAHGEVIAKVTLPSRLADACAFAGGVVMRGERARDLVWWRPGHDEVRLTHDIAPTLLCQVGAMAVSAEGEVLYLWRADSDGPEIPELDTAGMPLDEPIVIAGSVLRIRAGGRFVLRGETARGDFWPVLPGLPFRPATPRAEALSLMEAFVARRFEGPLPQTLDHLPQLPLAETLPLHGRAMVSPRSLDPELRQRSGFAREAWFAEIGFALGMSGRRVAAAARAGRFPLDPPRPIEGYEYLGSFTSSGNLAVGDPCYVGKPSKGAFALALSVEAIPGTWHVFARPGALTDADRTAELAVIHTDGFDVIASEPLGSFGVDSGTAGVFDRKCPKRDSDIPFEEGVVGGGLGGAAWSGYGDGFYPAFSGSKTGRIAKIRLVFMGPGPAELDGTFAAPKTGGRRYSPSARFEVGETLEHPRFGAGTVINVRADGKIEVTFADGPRVLVHAKA